ncbi:unnamed protein product [Protopolystoma xenopodis]|uniref:Uncharacterized protein n=1 Tax=Protopolystoma xenopodis TaxID=117903 RepID=A0A3S5C5X4_9PLAT|nr:unnamed protein product [Protopolystoma xenopodis]
MSVRLLFSSRPLRCTHPPIVRICFCSPVCLRRHSSSGTATGFTLQPGTDWLVVHTTADAEPVDKATRTTHFSPYSSPTASLLTSSHTLCRCRCLAPLPQSIDFQSVVDLCKCSPSLGAR